ncbi:MAG TPA: wax ester/triacylglycerol synthase family O-acyltransferase [Acidimicrobiia bacterium]|nr:wax ester/triacylglycerol synthase family O-acyltransferase [Acidimicrobiia bacterium]
MERLSGLDASFLGLETPTAHMHVLGVAVVDPESAPGGFGIEQVRALVRARLPVLPAFRRRLVPVPLGVHAPLWVDDPHFDLDFHLRRAAVPQPGGERELTELIADIAGRPLDRAKPLWEMWFVEGLGGGRVAIVAKVHHAAIDGVAGVDILASLFDLAPDAPLARDSGPAPAGAERERVPSDLELLARGVLSLVRQPFLFARNLGRLASTGVRVVSRIVGEPLRVASPLSAPKLTMNGVIGPRRTVAFARVPLADIKAIKNRFDVTVNDVVLALTAGALRVYLDGRDELPDHPLVAAVPTAVPTAEPGRGTGNHVSAMLDLLDVQVADPVERLRAIRRSAAGAKRVHAEFGGETLGEWAELAAPFWFGRAMRLFSSLRLAERFGPVINLVVSNVPGPPFPLYLAGARLESITPLGPVFDGCGLNVTVISYLDSVHVGFLACRDLVPDLDELAAAVPVALAELVAASDSLSPTTSRSRGRRTA